MKIYVGNMSYDVREDDLRQAFAEFGQVDSVNIIMDKFSGKSKGFGFVEMASKEVGQACIEALNGKDFKGRTITVNEARPQTRTQDARGGGRGGNRGGFGGGGRGGQGNKGNFGGGRGGAGGGKGGGFGGGGRGSRGGDR